MTRNHVEKETVDIVQRLQEIANLKLGMLSDDEVLSLLSERAQLLIREAEEKRQEVEEKQREAERKRQEAELAEKQRLANEQIMTLRQEIALLNQSISPEKSDNELLVFVKQRKELEERLEHLESESTNVSSSVAHPIETEHLPTSPILPVDMSTLTQGNTATSKAHEISSSLSSVVSVPSVESKNFKDAFQPIFGAETIEQDTLHEDSTLQHYLNQLKNNVGSLGTFLQEMPLEAKAHKQFMLKVAELDPAYAMHYADKTLKMNESFNVRIAAMKNPRNSGNPLAEMLPEARTSRVVLTAVRQDYRNVKFVQPTMEDYDEILRIAKMATLKKVQELQEAVDITLIVPRPLSQDKRFMEQVYAVIAQQQNKE
ncbi:MAG: hypothetical protein ACSLEX_03870 [Minisyncoccota bacterium]